MLTGNFYLDKARSPASNEKSEGARICVARVEIDIRGWTFNPGITTEVEVHVWMANFLLSVPMTDAT